MARIDGYRLHAIDLPGYGLTDTTPGFTDHLRSSAVSYLEDVCRSLELEQAAFIANSMGSLWTSWLALDRPKRIKALLHIGCPVIILNTSAPLQMRLLSIKILGRLLTYIQPPSRKQVKELSKMVNQHPMVPELISLLLATEQMPHFFPMFLSTLNSLIKLTGNRKKRRLTAEQLSCIQQPVQLFWGKDDPFGSIEIAERVQSALPDARLEIVEGGHTPWLNDTEKITRISWNFLKENYKTKTPLTIQHYDQFPVVTVRFLPNFY